MLVVSAELLTKPEKVGKISDCTSVACGAEFTMWLSDGKLWSAGSPQYGQLGHGTDHEYNAKDCEHSLQRCSGSFLCRRALSLLRGCLHRGRMTPAAFHRLFLLQRLMTLHACLLSGL